MRRLVASLTLALCAAAASAAGAPRVLFDEAHGQRFLVGRDGELDLSTLGRAFQAEGAQIETTSTALNTETFAGVQAVILSGAFAPLGAEEQEALLAHLERGGSLAVMLHIAPPVAELLRRLGIAVSNGVIRESDGVLYGNPIDFRVSRLARHPITAGLSGFALYGAWALLPESQQLTTLAETQPHAWVDLNHNDRYETTDAMQPFVVAVAGERGQGRFAVFGDDAMFQNRFLIEGRENRELAANLAAWLLGRERGDRLVTLGARPRSRTLR